MQEQKDDAIERIYLAIISRYKGYIEEKESISVAELPRLVMPREERVLRKVSEIKSGYPQYSYDANFADASDEAFRYVSGGVDAVVLPLQFWLSPGDVLAFGAGDKMDKAILLCSLMVALGNPSSKVLVVMRGKTMHVFVYCEFKDKIRAYEIDGAADDYASKDEFYSAVGTKNADTAYEFNNQAYADLY